MSLSTSDMFLDPVSFIVETSMSNHLFFCERSVEPQEATTPCAASMPVSGVNLKQSRLTPERGTQRGSARHKADRATEITERKGKCYFVVRRVTQRAPVALWKLHFLHPSVKRKRRAPSPRLRKNDHRSKLRLFFVSSAFQLADNFAAVQCHVWQKKTYLHSFFFTDYYFLIPQETFLSLSRISHPGLTGVIPSKKNLGFGVVQEKETILPKGGEVFQTLANPLNIFQNSNNHYELEYVNLKKKSF